MDITDRNFKHFIGTIPVCDFPGGFINKSVNISSDFSISMDCLPGNLLNSDSDIDEILNGFQKNNYEITLENDLGIDLNIHCYPSITDSDIFIENKMGNKYKVDIYSLSGQLKEEFDFERTYIKVDISAYNSGLYFISFHDLKTGKKKIEKIIKQ
jgi:Rps23 Pro-64 3,4-dihydroxylase Tpa1-like proline 4-hydroxylase